MSNPEIELIKKYASKVIENNQPLNKETFRKAYYEQLKESGENESVNVSEKWIDYFWLRLSKLSKSELKDGLKSENYMTDLCYKVLGK